MIYAPPLPPRIPHAHVKHAWPEEEAAQREKAEPLYPDRIGQTVEVLGFARGTSLDPVTHRIKHAPVIAPVIVVFPDGERGIAEESDLKPDKTKSPG